MAVLGLCFCVRAFSSCGKRGPLFIAVRWPLTIVASLVAEHRLQTCRLSSCGSRAYLVCGTWDPPRPGLEPVSPALAGRLSTTTPPGKPLTFFILKSILSDMSIGTPAFFWFPFAGNIFFHPLTFSLYVSLGLKWVSCRQHMYGSCFCIYSASLCLLAGAFNPFMFKVIINMYVPMTIFLIVLGLFL